MSGIIKLFLWSFLFAPFFAVKASALAAAPSASNRNATLNTTTNAASGTPNGAAGSKDVAPGGKALNLPGSTQPASSSDLKIMRALDLEYQKATAVKMNVDKTLKLGLLGQERKAKGTLMLSSGRLRLELEGEEKSLLIVNGKTYWAVTYPSADFKEAPVQVITGSTGSKKGRSQSILGLLTQGGFLKFFNVAGVQKNKAGEITYFLQPQKSASEFKRAELKVSVSGKEILELHYWDERDNETLLAFKDISFGKKPAESQFTFDPPANAEVMKM